MPGKIVLVQPKTGEWDFAGSRPPDSLLAIAALPHKEGYNVKIIDQRIDKNWRETLRREIKDAMLFGTSSMTGPQIKYALEASKIVKQNSEIPVVWGGVHSSLLPEQTIENKNIDVVVKGEGDFSFLEVIKAIENGKGLNKVRGIYYKHNKKILKTGERELIKDLDTLPDYPYEIIDLKNYYGFNIGKGKSITLMTSRGCPFRCAFCYNTVYYHNTWRGMSSKRTMEMIRRAVNELGVKSIYFQDDNFCANIKRFEEIVNSIIKEKLDISWGLLGARVNTLKQMSDGLLSNSVKAGCMDIDVGAESGSDRILKLISKDVNIQEVIDVNKKLAKYFDKTKYTFIMGIPTETESELLQSVKLAVRLSKENPHVLPLFLIYAAYPGTKLYELSIKKGFKVPRNLEGWAEMNFESAYLLYPWLDKKRIKMMKNFEFTSLFASKNNEYKINSKLLIALARLYRPFAKVRFEKNIYQLPAERVLARIVSRRVG